MTRGPRIDLSVVAPAHNEQDNVGPLVGELAAALEPLGLDYEMIVVDDGSTDQTPVRLRDLLATHDRLVVVRLSDTPPGRGLGQSAAFGAGVQAARGELIAMLDADGQNDPADLPALLALMQSSGADLVQGDRSGRRRDTLGRRLGSLLGRLFRRGLLGDTVRDTGCSLRVMRAEVARSIPFDLAGMHRFLPITARQTGFTVVEKPVNHRPRRSGSAKYGVWNRALPALVDCLGVRWMGRRRRSLRYEIIERPGRSAAAPPPLATAEHEARA